jgi:hypothetical protein
VSKATTALLLTANTRPPSAVTANPVIVSYATTGQTDRPVRQVEGVHTIRTADVQASAITITIGTGIVTTATATANAAARAVCGVQCERPEVFQRLAKRGAAAFAYSTAESKRSAPPIRVETDLELCAAAAADVSGPLTRRTQ